MHNSESWAHRSPVAVAQKVTQVIIQTVENQHFYWCSTSNIKQNLFDEATYFFKIAKEIWKKYKQSVQLSMHLVYYLFCFNAVCKFRGTHWCVKRHWQYKNCYYIVGQWKLHLYWVDPFCPSNILWPHTSDCAYKLHSKVCMDSPCSYSRSLVSKAC